MNNSILLFLLNTRLVFLIPVLLMQAYSSEKMSSETRHETEYLSFAVVQQIMMSMNVDTIDIKIEKIYKTEEEWKEELTPTECYILRGQGTEVPFDNEYWNNKEKGTYYCRACGLPLFHSNTKYNSGTGWPSFWEPLAKQVVEEREDNSYDMTRVEIVCARCGSHLGHVFNDGPEPTGLRYCVNSTALKFEKANSSNSQSEVTKR